MVTKCKPSVSGEIVLNQDTFANTKPTSTQARESLDTGGWKFDGSHGIGPPILMGSSLERLFEDILRIGSVCKGLIRENCVRG